MSLGLFASTHEAFGSTPAESANKEQWRAAQKLFEAADELYDAGKYSEAVTAYRASYDIVASPNSRLMIARSLVAIGQFTPARDELEQAIVQADGIAKYDAKYAQTAQAARTELEALLAKVGRLSIALKGGMTDASVSVNDVQIPKAQLTRPLLLAPGRVVVTATTANGQVARQELELKAGAEQSVELAGPALPGAAGDSGSEAATHGGTGRTALVLTSAGLGAAGVITFAVFGVLSNKKLGELESQCPDGRCPSDPHDDVNAGKRYQLIANVGLGVGAVGLGTAATLWLLGRNDGAHEHAAVPQLTLTERSAQLAWQGRF